MKEIQVQQATMQHIVEYIYKSDVINNAIKNVCPREHLYEFVPFFHAEMCNMKYDKLLKAYNKGYIDWLCIRVITNQVKSSTSKFHYQYRNGKFTDKYRAVFNTEERTDEYSKDAHAILINNLTSEGDEYDVEADQFMEHRAQLVRQASKKLDWYSKNIWDQYFNDKLTCAQISRVTGINYNSVYHNLTKSKRIIKEFVLAAEEQAKPKHQREPNFNKFIDKTRRTQQC